MTNKQFLKTTTALVALSFAFCESARAENNCEQGYIKGVNSGNCIPASGSCGSGCTYTLDEKGTIHMTGNGNGVTGGHVIRNHPNNGDIVSVIVGKGIKEIGFRSFNQDGFHYMTIEEGVTTIGDGSLNCIPLNVLVIPASVTSLGDNGAYISAAATYCTAAQIANCGNNAVLYEKKNDLYYVYDENGKVSEVFGGYANFNANVAKAPAERDRYIINEDGSVSILDKNGTLTADYNSEGNLQKSYTYGEDGSYAEYDNKGIMRYARGEDGSSYRFDAKGNLTGMTKRGPFTIPEANALTKDGPVNTVTITW